MKTVQMLVLSSILFISFTFFWSCEFEGDNEINNLIENESWFLIFPESACITCVEKSLEFIEKLIPGHKVYFINKSDEYINNLQKYYKSMKMAGIKSKVDEFRMIRKSGDNISYYDYNNHQNNEDLYAFIAGSYGSYLKTKTINPIKDTTFSIFEGYPHFLTSNGLVVKNKFDTSFMYFKDDFTFDYVKGNEEMFLFAHEYTPLAIDSKSKGIYFALVDSIDKIVVLKNGINTYLTSFDGVPFIKTHDNKISLVVNLFNEKGFKLTDITDGEKLLLKLDGYVDDLLVSNNDYFIIRGDDDNYYLSLYKRAGNRLQLIYNQEIPQHDRIDQSTHFRHYQLVSSELMVEITGERIAQNKKKLSIMRLSDFKPIVNTSLTVVNIRVIQNENKLQVFGTKNGKNILIMDLELKNHSR